MPPFVHPLQKQSYTAAEVRTLLVLCSHLWDLAALGMVYESL